MFKVVYDTDLVVSGIISSTGADPSQIR